MDPFAEGNRRFLLFSKMTVSPQEPSEIDDYASSAGGERWVWHADEGYAVLRQALAESGKVAIGQLIMTGRAHLVGIKALDKGLMLSILRYAEEVRPAEPYFDRISAEPAPEAVRLATELVKAQSGEFAPETMPHEFARAVRELVQAKIEERAPEIEVNAAGEAPTREDDHLKVAISVGVLRMVRSDC